MVARRQLLRPDHIEIGIELMQWCIMFITPPDAEPQGMGQLTKALHSAFVGFNNETISSILRMLEVTIL